MTNEEVREKVPQTYGQRMLFTGPDGIGDYQTRFIDFPQHIGISPMSPEATSDVNYLFRASLNPPPPPLGHGCVGGVGWGLQYHQLLNSETLFSNMQIKRSEIRSALEDRVTHRYQNPWTAPPHFLDKQSAGARGRLAWTPNMYDSYSKDVNKRFLLNKVSR
ncbi:protein SPMIP2 [Osmerus mordax]|uniref:protein SPMIP2 n=1 Tax=Osmerus mordax TaxID=8014 RepID=UPI00350F3308